MATTGKTLDDTYFDNNLTWFIGSVPPFYCSNNGAAGGSNLNSDQTYIGTSFVTQANPAVPTRYTNGVKFAVAIGDGGENPGNQIKYTDGTGNPQSFLALSDSLSPYVGSGNHPAQFTQTPEYQIGSNRDQMFFGPYDLSKTIEPSVGLDDGDIVFITTGSDVIGGELGDGADPYSGGDNRAWNLIFYSTGSANMTLLSEWVGHINQTGRLASVTLQDYSPQNRQTWYEDTGVGGFVGIRSVSSVNDVIWWPLTYDDNDVDQILSRNDS